MMLLVQLRVEGHNLSRTAGAHAAVAAPVKHTYARNRTCPRKTTSQDINEGDDKDQDQHGESDSATATEDEEESIHTADGSAVLHQQDLEMDMEASV